MGETLQIHGIREAEGVLEVGAHGLEGLQGTGDHPHSYVRDEMSEAQPGSETLRLWREQHNSWTRIQVFGISEADFSSAKDTMLAIRDEKSAKQCISCPSKSQSEVRPQACCRGEGMGRMPKNSNSE